MKALPGYSMKWLKALMLSPGVLFALAYIALWNATNLYLDHTFRGKLGRAFSAAAGSRYSLTIGSLGIGPDCSTLTLKRLEMVAVGARNGTLPHRIILDKLDIRCPEIGLIFIMPSMAEAATMQVSKALLDRCDGRASSMDHQAGPAPADRGDLAYRVGQQGEVRIP